MTVYHVENDLQLLKNETWLSFKVFFSQLVNVHVARCLSCQVSVRQVAALNWRSVPLWEGIIISDVSISVAEPTAEEEFENIFHANETILTRTDVPAVKFSQFG